MACAPVRRRRGGVVSAIMGRSAAQTKPLGLRSLPGQAEARSRRREGRRGHDDGALPPSEEPAAVRRQAAREAVWRPWTNQ
ncbi:hypothetical protein FM125_06585 [Micrococcus lylae]|uniref:Uncharacterized protein n=1 Tax=Micrococcus lylae TaxID=1273 RepID=A0A1R4J5G6_9MICC|nr:hypothetical protein FM125_06585 [Micrococcus lylae]